MKTEAEKEKSSLESGGKKEILKSFSDMKSESGTNSNGGVTCMLKKNYLNKKESRKECAKGGRTSREFDNKTNGRAILCRKAWKSHIRREWRPVFGTWHNKVNAEKKGNVPFHI